MAVTTIDESDLPQLTMKGRRTRLRIEIGLKDHLMSLFWLWLVEQDMEMLGNASSSHAG